MSSQSLMNQIITVYTRDSYDGQGREVMGDSLDVLARIQPKSRNIFDSNSQLVTIVAVAYVPADIAIEIDDKVKYSGQNLKVYSKYEVPDGDGNTDHIRLELVKWLTA